jgi:hypothetical protein
LRSGTLNLQLERIAGSSEHWQQQIKQLPRNLYLRSTVKRRTDDLGLEHLPRLQR